MKDLIIDLNNVHKSGLEGCEPLSRFIKQIVELASWYSE